MIFVLSVLFEPSQYIVLFPTFVTSH